MVGMEDKLLFNIRNFTVTKAGLPSFKRNFSRDSFLSLFLLEDVDLLRQQLNFSAFMQGKQKDSFTGEEVGKIHHEYPEVIIRGQSTQYNACETTALFLLAHDKYCELTSDCSLLDEQKEVITKAISYIVSHIRDGLFIESPSFCDAKKFALKVTYWKDSVLVNREQGEPIYPVVYALAHVQNLAALRAIKKYVDYPKLDDICSEMSDALQSLWDEDTGCFIIAKDDMGTISGVTSDSLHALYYLEPGDLSPEQIAGLCKSASQLESDIGYTVMDKGLATTINDSYHARAVWPFEQAFIHAGAEKFNLPVVMSVSQRISNHIRHSFPELFYLENGKFVPGGCNLQLWTLAAAHYFKK
jgi:glycogen debranching enzyme